MQKKILYLKGNNLKKNKIYIYLKLFILTHEKKN